MNFGLGFGGFEEAFQLPDSRGMAHLPEGFGLDLSDALSRDTELASYFFKGPAVAIDQPEPLLQNLALALRQCFQDVLNLLFQENNRRHVARVLRAFVLDEISEICLFALPDRRLQRNW